MLAYEWIITIVVLVFAIISLIDTIRKVRSPNGFSNKKGENVKAD